ncbi:MAG: hypothetical protein LPJ87_03040 [Zoogloeaceae bacterium]|nr:hypothetical protein [Zoogloeaceae bacterium]
MQNVSPLRPTRSRIAYALQCLAGAAGAAVSLAVAAGGTFPAVSQNGQAVSSRPAEVIAVDRRSIPDQRLSLKRALVDGGQLSGSEERRHLSSEERRILMRDLRDAARDANEGAPRPGN